MSSQGEDPKGWTGPQEWRVVSPEPPKAPKDSKDWSHKIIAVTAVLAVVLAVPAAIWYARDLVADPAIAPTSAPSTPVAVAPPATDLPTTNADSVSPCFLAGVGIACSAAHDAELITATACDEAGLVVVMGGNPAIEILRGGLTYSAQSGGCLVGGLDRFAVVSSVQGLLQSDQGDGFRVCRDDATATEVGCDTRHSAELIYRNGQDVDCAASFQTYTGDTFANRSGDLKLTKTAGQSVECWVGPRLTNPLTASVRNLKNQTLPLGDP